MVALTMFFRKVSAMVSQALTDASWKKTTTRVDWVLKLEGVCLTAACTILEVHADVKSAEAHVADGIYTIASHSTIRSSEMGDLFSRP